MHIILALLGVIVTILILLNRLQENGLDVGWLNPFSWNRRRRYRLEHDLNPAFKLDSPMDVVALYMFSVAKVDGEISREQKEKILELFKSEFHLNHNDAVALLSSSAHLFGQTDDVIVNPQKVIERSYDKFTSEQVQSLFYLLDEVSKVESSGSEIQKKLISSIKSASPKFTSEKWSN